MKSNNWGYCGVDCEKCQVLIATEANDDSLRKSYAEMLKSKYNVILRLEDINCSGCVKGTIEGSILTGHCRDCDVRKCAGEKKVGTCSACGEYICPKLTRKWDGFPVEIKEKARENLDSL